MTKSDIKNFNEQNRTILLYFIKGAEKYEDDISASVITIMVQFLLNVRTSLFKKADEENCVTLCDLITAQIEELRRCVIDLELCSNLMKNGATNQ